VPGDIIRLRIGDIIPADAKSLEDSPVEVDQSALTGESLPVTKTKGEALYSGSIIKQGEIDAVVEAIGENTYLGKTAHLVGSVRMTSHFQRAIMKIGRSLIFVALLLVVLIIGVTVFRGDNLMTALQFVLVLTVASIPVAMPTVLSVTMAVGAQKLARNQAIVSRLASIEEMAGVDVLCSDKTGTLTQNTLTMGEPFCLEGVSQDQLMLFAALASRREDQDPIDLAMLKALKESDSISAFQIVDFQPFDPVKKRTQATVKDKRGQVFKVAKGAPQVIMSLAAPPADTRSRLDQSVLGFAQHGYRSLGIAKTDEKESWQMLGIVPLYDPPRADSKETILDTRQMGVKVKMLTGDQMAIAKEIARQLDLGPNILDASMFKDSDHPEAGELTGAIEKADGFAQVFPEHKYRIVEALQQRDHIVAMTGDGVNDAPALKRADCGIAVSGAVDAARSAADIVLLAPGLSVINKAIRESRTIFARMTNYAIYRIAETLRVLLFMTLSILVFNFYPVTAVMIVLLALLNDGAILSIAYDRVQYSNRPERWNMPRVFGIASVLGIMGVIASFGMFYLGEKVFHLDREMIRSMMYLKLSVAGHLTIFVARTKRAFWSSPPAPILVLAVLGTQLIATLIATLGLFMAPIGWKWAGFIWVYALIWFLINDRVKLLAYRIMDRHS
jgi:H+-transporting ATPase